MATSWTVEYDSGRGGSTKPRIKVTVETSDPEVVALIEAAARGAGVTLAREHGEPPEPEPELLDDLEVAAGKAKKKATLADVARSAGFSVTTVTRVLNGKEPEKVSQPTRAIVLATAHRLGYEAPATGAFGPDLDQGDRDVAEN